MKGILIGANGQLGGELKEVWAPFLEENFTKEHLDVTIKEHVLSLVSIKPDFILNASAFTDVDMAEERIEEAFRVNCLGVYNLSLLASKLDIPLIHYSTNYVFSGNRTTPYKEDDAPSPVNIYGLSKLSGEYIIKMMVPRYYIIRTANLFGGTRKGVSKQGRGNFIEIMIKLAKEGKDIKVIDDQFFSPTYTKDLAWFSKELWYKGLPYGVYNIVNSGVATWYSMAYELFKILGWKVNLIPVKSKDFPNKAKRPYYSVLSLEKIIKEGLGLPRFWKKALAEYLKERLSL